MEIEALAPDFLLLCKLGVARINNTIKANEIIGSKNLERFWVACVGVCISCFAEY
jgi:hypothetical protein